MHRQAAAGIGDAAAASSKHGGVARAQPMERCGSKVALMVVPCGFHRNEGSTFMPPIAALLW